MVAQLAAAMVMVLGGWSCATPPPLVPTWKLPPEFVNGSRVRVVAPRLGPAWQPGRAVLSTAGCWTIAAAVTQDPKAITILTPGELSRLQLSRAVPPPDWWAIPSDNEGWTEILPTTVEDANAPTCPRHRPRIGVSDTARDSTR